MSKKLLVAALCITMVLTMGFVTASAEEYVYVTGDVLNIRNGPSTENTILGQAVYRDSLIVHGTQDGWFKISYWGITGWVSGDYVSYTKPSAGVQEPSTGEKVVAHAKNFIGIPYVYGGSTTSGFDCSGFVKYVFSNFGVNLPRTSYSQMNVGTAITRDQLQPGDLVVFRGGGHVGIYTGNNQYIHAPQTGRVVSIDDMNRELYCARRLVW